MLDSLDGKKRSYGNSTNGITFTLVKSVQTSHHLTRAQSKKTILKAWNNIEIDFHQEMGQEYSTIMQIIVKADCRKAIAWRSVSCKMTCYYIPDVKTLQILSLHFVPTLQSAVYILYPVYSLLSAFFTNRCRDCFFFFWVAWLITSFWCCEPRFQLRTS